MAEFIIEKLCSIANSLADHAVEQLRSQDNVTVMVIFISDPNVQRVSNGLVEKVSDSYWLTHDIRMIGKEVEEESEIDVALLTRRRNSCDPGYMIRLNSSNSGDDSSNNSRGSSRGGREMRRLSDVGLINRLNSMNDLKNTDQPIKREIIFSKPKSANVNQNVNSEKLGIAESKIHVNEKDIVEVNGKKKGKDEDDLMDFLLDDTNF